MPEVVEEPGLAQAVQEKLMDRARDLPGVAALLDVYGKLLAYTWLVVNVQPSQTCNATGGNADWPLPPLE